MSFMSFYVLCLRAGTSRKREHLLYSRTQCDGVGCMTGRLDLTWVDLSLFDKGALRKYNSEILSYTDKNK